MSEHDLIVVGDSLDVGPSGATVGVVYWQVAGDAFPSADWDDFVIRILSWWMLAAEQLLSGARHADFLFMDGPYSVRVSRENGDRHKAVLYRRSTSGKQIIASADLTMERLVAALCKAVPHLLDMCGDRKLNDADVSSLEAHWLNFQKHCKSM